MGHSLAIDVKDSRPIGFDGPQPPANKLLGLELMRFAAALAVLLNHYRFFADMAGVPALDRTNALLSLLWPFFNYGHFGVEVFWGISGYIFFWKYGTAIHSRAVGGREFFWLRFSRLYPLHLATLLLAAGLQAIHRQVSGHDFIYPATDGASFVRQLLLATDWGPPVAESFNGPIWSISAEIAIYAAFFMLLRRFGPSARMCVGMIIAGLVAQLAGLEWASIGCATYFFAGGLAALVPSGEGRSSRVVPAALLALCLGMAVLGDRGKVPMILLLAVPCLLIVMARNWQWMERWQQQLRFAGNLTYSSYLLHFPLQLLLAIGVGTSGIVPDPTNPVFFIGWLAATLATAALCHRLFEMPAQAWIRQRTLKKVAAG